MSAHLLQESHEAISPQTCTVGIISVFEFQLGSNSQPSVNEANLFIACKLCLKDDETRKRATMNVWRKTQIRKQPAENNGHMVRVKLPLTSFYTFLKHSKGLILLRLCLFRPKKYSTK